MWQNLSYKFHSFLLVPSNWNDVNSVNGGGPTPVPVKSTQTNALNNEKFSAGRKTPGHKNRENASRKQESEGNKSELFMTLPWFVYNNGCFLMFFFRLLWQILKFLVTCSNHQMVDLMKLKPLSYFTLLKFVNMLSILTTQSTYHRVLYLHAVLFFLAGPWTSLNGRITAEPNAVKLKILGLNPSGSYF